MQVPTLSIMVSDANPTAKSYVYWDVLHGFGVESGLEFRAHESITVAWVDQAKEVNAKHCHIKCDRNDNKTEYSSNQVLCEKTLCWSV